MRELIRGSFHAAQKPSFEVVWVYICRMKGHEPGIKVAELGSEDLLRLNIAAFSRRERWELYKRLLWLLVNLEFAGYAHGDIKTENMVVIRDSAGLVFEIKLIDLDTLARVGDRVSGGTMVYFSPKRMKDYLYAVQRPWAKLIADPKDDVWAMMGAFCELEWKALKRHPDSDAQALISPKILERWQRYLYAQAISTKQAEIRQLKDVALREAVLQKQLSHFKKALKADNGSFFYCLDNEFPLDSLMMAMSKVKNWERPSASELFLEYFQKVPEGLDL